MSRHLAWAMLVILCVILSGSAVAASGSVVVGQVQAGASSGEASITAESAATKEFISIYNNTADAIDVTDWCLVSKSGLPPFVCMTLEDDEYRLYLQAYSYATFSSSSFANQHNYVPDFMYLPKSTTSGTLVASSDEIRLLDTSGAEVDKVGWLGLDGGEVLQRQKEAAPSLRLMDTDQDGDFVVTSELVVPEKGLEERVVVADACDNLDGFQLSVPDGYYLSAPGECVTIPDECDNLSGYQEVVPEFHKKTSDGRCLLDLPPLVITELLPNPIGTDKGNEFIEIYNPGNNPVDLSYYLLYVGSDETNYYRFPAGVSIDAGQYKAFYDQGMKFVLVNSAGGARLRSTDGQLIDLTEEYASSKEGETWALINGEWVYTNQSTPGAANKPRAIESSKVVVSTLKPCGPGQYRNPATNRCKSIASTSSTLVPCKEGQYRSEITNRCRSIAVDAALKPCPVGQYRNPETNRCKSILGASTTLAACGPGEERNPETNRCRKIATKVMPTVAYAVEPIESDGQGLDWWVLSGVLVVALAYAVWEWRPEAMAAYRKLRRR